MKILKRFKMSYKLMTRLIEMVERAEISKTHPIFNGQYDKMKSELEKDHD